MLMTLQNKITVAVKSLFDKAKQVGGIPEKVELNSIEFEGLLREMNKFRTRPGEYPMGRFKFLYDKEDGRMIVGVELKEHRFAEIVQDWIGGKFEIIFDKTPIVYNPSVPTTELKIDRTTKMP